MSLTVREFLDLRGQSLQLTVRTGQGRALDREIREGEISSPGLALAGFTERFRMVRIGDRKIVRVNAEPWQMYDLAEDPTELEDLATQRPAELGEMVEAYRRWVREQEAVMPRWDEVEKDGPPST